MPAGNPTIRDVRADSFLSDFAIQHGQDLAKNFVADRASTMVRVDSKTDKYPIWSLADFMRDDMQPWADGDKAARGGFTKTDGTFDCKRWGLVKELSKPTKANDQVSVEQAGINWLMQKAKLKRDAEYAAKFFVTGVWTANTEQTGVSGAPGANQFQGFNEAGSDPIGVIRTQMDQIETQTGRLPNTVVVDALTNSVLKDHADVLDRYKYTGGGGAVITEEMLGDIWGVNYVVARATNNTAAQGQSASMSRLFGDNVLIAYIHPEMSKDEPTAIGLFSWSEFDFVDEFGAAISTFFDWDTDSDWMRASQYFDMQITSNDLGVFLLNTIV